MATYYFELIEEGGTVYVIQRNDLSLEFFDITSFSQQPVVSQYNYRWLLHPEALKDIEFDVEVLDVIKLPIPQGYPGDQVYGEFIHVDLVYNPNGILAPDGNKYPFWIAYSPYPSSQAEYENPCVAYSKDGITWRSDFTLPLIEKPANSHNSDPELFELDDGRLCLINRQYNFLTYNLQFMIYTPGSGWSNPVTFVSSSQDVLKCPSVVKDPSCGEREFVLFTTRAYTNLRRQTLIFSEDYSSATVGDAVVCNVIDVDTGNPITSDHVNIKFLDNQYVGIVLDGYYNLYWVVSLDGYNFYAKKVILKNETIGRGFPYRADFVVQEDGTILLYLPFTFDSLIISSSGSYGSLNPFLLLAKASPRAKTNIWSILQPFPIAGVGVSSSGGRITSGGLTGGSIFPISGYSGGSNVYYYLSFVDKQGNESNKFFIGMATSSSSFNVGISIHSDTTSAYKYRLYRSYNSDSILNITDVYPDLLDPGSSIVDNNSNWIPVSNTTIVGTGGKVLGYDETDGYIFTNKGIKVGETTRPPFVIESTGLVENLNSDLLDGKHASDFASSVHTHTKADISDLETITITPTANAIPKADGNGKLNLGWLDLSNYALLNGNNTFTGINIFGSSVAFPITLVSSDLTLADTHYTVLVDALEGDITITLPSAEGIDGRIYIVKRIDNSFNPVVIQPQEGQYIDGQSSFVLTCQYATVEVQAFGGQWYIISKVEGNCSPQ
jgi:hypothetical protein